MSQYSDYIYYGHSRENFDYFQLQVLDTLGVDLTYFSAFETMDKYFQEKGAVPFCDIL
ncbi:hypothetical protein OKW96_04180 [Sphingobacterium sp. KU25419]|nr:hypothetical protein OKW96_04180 [Sphingobacterium sp. KU25419]